METVIFLSLETLLVGAEIGFEITLDLLNELLFNLSILKFTPIRGL